MTRSKKRKQITQYVGNTTLAPELRDDESDNKRIGKRIKTMHEISYLPFFTRAMTEKLNSLIISKISKSDSKTLEKNIKKLKEYIINRKTLPPGLLQQASEYANEAILHQTGERSTLTSSAYKNRLDNEVPKKLIDIWNEYTTEDRFDTIVNQEKSRINVAIREQGSSSTAAQGFHSSVSREEVLQYRTCPASFKKRIRKDLPDAVNNAVRSKLTDAIVNASDFQAHFLSIIEMFTIIFKTHGLSMDSGAIRTSVDILDILPNNFIKDKQLKSTLSASPLPERVKLKYKDELISLFTEQHLKLIQSYYFGARGSSEETLEKHPLQNLLFEIMASEGIQRGSFKQKCKSEEMTNLMTKIITNIKNMWSTNNIFQKLLDKVLLVLLRQHLAPQRETLKQEEVKKKKRDKAHPSLHKRNVVHYEKKKLKKLTKKLNNADPQERAKLVERFEKSKVRVKNFQRLPKSAFSLKAGTNKKTTATTGDLKKEDQPKKDETKKKKWPEKEEKPNEALDEFVKDATSARILAVRSVLKHMLLYDPSCTASLLKERLYEATEKEIATIKLLFKFFKPYIPQKEDRLSIGHQLPLCILANDVLSILDYAKFVRKLFPVPKFSRLLALEVNSTALYQILTARPSPLKIADFDHFEIESVDFARSNAAAVMNSIFDLNVVNQVCESHRLVFANRIMVMPGLKTARLLGTRKDSKNSPEESSASSLVDRILTNTSIVEEAKKEFNVLKREVDTLEGNMKTLQNDLKVLLKKNEPLELSAKIKEKKKERNDCEDQGLRGEILAEMVLLKNKRFEEYRKIQASQKAVSDAKQSLHFRRMAMRYHHRLRRSAPATTDPEERPELSKNTIGLFKATECNIKKPADFVFSGTDNGLVNMSTTTPFTLDRFKFHLKLYNRYQVLSEENVEIDESDDEVEQFFKLPIPLVINAADVDIGCGYRKARLKLEREKKSSTSGKAVSDAEKELSKKPLNVNLTIPEYLENKEVHVGQSATVRNFYGSAKRATKSRTVEIQKQKFTNRLVSKEKESIKRTVGKRKIVQFVGDRGTGVGSRIKGFRKYGGKWLEVLRSYQNIVCITNEHNTSQLCIYCFEKLCHSRSSNKKISKGALQCVNPGCVSVKAGKAVKSRDALSSLAIGLWSLQLPIRGDHASLLSKQNQSIRH